MKDNIEKVDFIYDQAEPPLQVASTIVDCSDGGVNVVREGAVRIN